MEPKDRSDSLEVVHFVVDPPDLRAWPAEKVDAIAQALAQGRRVELSPLEQGASKGYPSLSPEALERFLDVGGVFMGGVILTLVSLAIAPGSNLVALMAGALGAAGTAIGLRLYRKRNQKLNEPPAPV